MKSPAVLLIAFVCLYQPEIFADAIGEVQRGDEEQQVLEYLNSHPEFLLEYPELLQRTLALQQKAQQKADTARRYDLMHDREDTLFSSKLTPVRGNAAAPYTLIEFSDYQCIPCKLSFPAVEAFFRERSDIRLIQLQLPIYGPQSIMAARAALIAQSLGSFEKYNTAMMQSPNPADLPSIEAALALAGVSEIDFTNGMTEPRLSDYLKEVRKFSEELNVIGTPAFLLNGKLINGAADEKTLKEALTQLEQDGE